MSKWGVHPWHGARPLLCSSETPKYPRAHLQPGEAFTSCVHTSCADGSASNVRLVAILGRTQSAHHARLAVGVAGRRPGPAWVPTRSPPHPTHGTANTSARLLLCPQPSWVRTDVTKGQKGVTGPRGLMVGGEAPQGCSQPGVSKLHGTRWSIT